MARALLVLRVLAMASTARGYADELLKQDGLENRCARRLGPAEANIMNRPQVGGVEPVVTFGGKGCGVNYRDGEALTVEVHLPQAGQFTLELFGATFTAETDDAAVDCGCGGTRCGTSRLVIQRDWTGTIVAAPTAQVP